MISRSAGSRAGGSIHYKRDPERRFAAVGVPARVVSGNYLDNRNPCVSVAELCVTFVRFLLERATAFELANVLGAGFLEKVYERALIRERA
jgi:hypothetical protein